MRFLLFAPIAATVFLAFSPAFSDSFRSTFDPSAKRHWIGSEYWSNRLQDWRLHNGRVECVNSTLPRRTVHILAGNLDPAGSSLELSITVGAIYHRGRL